VVEGTWDGGVKFNRKPIPYLVFTGSENQERLAGPKLITHRLVLDGSSCIMRDGGKTSHPWGLDT
jgi:hypothetical protein